MASSPHPAEQSLTDWIRSHSQQFSSLVQPLTSPGAGYGLFARQDLSASEPLFTVPASALMNVRTLSPHYPAIKPPLTCTQIIALHLMLHRPRVGGYPSDDPLFGPYISVLPADFGFHPFKWFSGVYKNDHGETRQIDQALVVVLPEEVLAKLRQMWLLYRRDWKRVKSYLMKFPALLLATEMRNEAATGDLLERDMPKYESNFLWGWLNGTLFDLVKAYLTPPDEELIVNTRCIYHRLCKKQSDPDNMTLCPILDFANHRAAPPLVYPQPTHAEIWNSAPRASKKFGDDFVLLAPPDGFTPAGTELFLRYGRHSNVTLFCEYGFVDTSSSEAVPREANVDDAVTKLFEARGRVGEWMKAVLEDAGYWGDWTIHERPGRAHPSYRLMTALRLYHVLPATTVSQPSNEEGCLQGWRNVILGNTDIVSGENEALWRATLKRLCEEVEGGAIGGIAKVDGMDAGGEAPDGDAGPWLGDALKSVRALWEERQRVARAVLLSIEKGVEFG